MRKLVKASLAVAALSWVFVAPASAASLELTDAHGTVWTLTVEEACTTDCNVLLEADFADPSTLDGKFLDAVQWQVDGADIDGDDAGIQLTDTNAGATTDWATFNASLSGGNDCGQGGAPGAGCSEYTAGVGFEVNSGDQLFWEYSVDWVTALDLDATDLGNIRAAFNNADGSNFYTFSPGGTNFTTEIVTTTTEVVTTTTENIPEPTVLTLLGAGLVMAGRRLRRRTK